MIRIAAMQAGEAAARDKYVFAHPEGSVFHLSGWMTALQRGFGFTPHCLVAHEQDRLVGVLPLALVRRPPFASAIISVPGGVYGGVLADDAAISRRLEDAAAELARGTGVAWLELRNRDEGREDWPVSRDYCRFGFALQADTAAVLAGIPRKRRAEIRKGAGNDLVVEQDSTVDRFYRLYARGVRDLGSPVFPRAWFQALLAQFPGAVEVTIVLHRNEPVLGLMSFRFRDQVLPYYVGALPQARALRAFDHVYWDLACRAAADGCRWFDFGRSILGSGACESKQTWGLVPQPLAYRYCLVRAREVPHLNPDNPLLRPAVAAWRRLPLPLANRLGPWLSRIAV